MNERQRATRKIRQVGNSLGVLLPKQMIDGWLPKHAEVRVVRLGRYIVLSPLLREPLTEETIKQTLREVGASPPELAAE